MMRSLFIFGLSAASLIANEPQIYNLSNGVTAYVQDYEGEACSLRVVQRNASQDEVLFGMDGSFSDAEQFFSSCREKIGNSSIELAVIAVGKFPTDAMQTVIAKHFGDLPFSSEIAPPIQISSDPNAVKVAIHIAYPHPIYGDDLKQAWQEMCLQEIVQQRLERASKALKEEWVHPRSRFFYPVSGYALASPEASENLLSYLLWQVQTIRSSGFTEEEFSSAKQSLLFQLSSLSSQTPDQPFLASYYADQFLLGETRPVDAGFFETSSQIVINLRPEEVHSSIPTLLADGNIQVIYPQGADPLTEAEVKAMIPAHLAAAPVKTDLPILLTASGGTEPFYQLPLNEKEKRHIWTIITTMSEKNIFQLAFEKGSMEKRGNKINHVHPMRFLGYIFSEPELKSCVKNIKKSSFKWDAFVDGFARRMREEYSNNNVMQYVPGFAQQVGSNPDKVKQYIQNKDWEGLVKSLL